MAPKGEAYEVDWRVSNTSNVHVANDREWFTQYTPIDTHIGSIYSRDTKLKVLGLGQVELEVKTHPTRGGSRGHRTITLQNVLYCPEIPFNIIGSPFLEEYPLFQKDGLKSATGKVGLIFDNIRLDPMQVVGKVWLKGHRKGHSSADPNVLYMLNALWADTERNRCLAELEAQLKNLTAIVAGLRGPVKTATQDSAAKTNTPDPVPSASSKSARLRYTQEEQHWLKKHYGNEYHFLQGHGLSIYKEEDRDEGRDIMRAMMLEDSSSEVSEENDFLADLERDPTSHVADRHFNEQELDWIEKHFRHSGNFLHTYGLKPFDDDDAKDGKRIVAAILKEEKS